MNSPVRSLTCSTGTILGAQYFTVEPDGGNWKHMEEWCIQTFGDASEVWNIGKDSEFMWPDCGRWYMNNRRFWFRDEKDRDWFLIRWNS